MSEPAVEIPARIALLAIRALESSKRLHEAAGYPRHAAHADRIGEAITKAIVSQVSDAELTTALAAARIESSSEGA